jgi:ligand-binding sensor domain-containing protein
MQSRLIVPSLFAALLMLICGQATAEPPMIFQHLGSSEGLPQNTVMQTLQDSQGFIWIATEDGLARYDGYEVHRYAHDRDKGDSLPGNFAWAMAEDRHGDLWVALKDAGLARWNRRTDRFSSFRHDPANSNGLSSDALRALLIDRRGHIWIGTTGSGLDEFDPATGIFRHYTHDMARADSLSSDVVTSLWQESDGQIWVGTDDGLNRLIAASRSFQRYRSEPGQADSLSSNKVSVIAPMCVAGCGSAPTIAGSIFWTAIRALSPPIVHVRRTRAAWQATKCAPCWRIVMAGSGLAPQRA